MGDEQERINMVLQVLKRKPLTTKQIEVQMAKVGFECPEDLVRLLNRLRIRGIIKGQPSSEVGGWLWWTESGEHC